MHTNCFLEGCYYSEPLCTRKAAEEEDWEKKPRGIDGLGGWKILSDEAVKKLCAAPHP